MIPVWEKVYNTTLAETEERRFECAKCGHHDRMFVAAHADGTGSAAYGLFAEEAQRTSLEKASAKMLRTMEFAAARASCPNCGFTPRASGVPLPLLVERLREQLASTEEAERSELEQLREENRALKAKLAS